MFLTLALTPSPEASLTLTLTLTLTTGALATTLLVGETPNAAVAPGLGTRVGVSSACAPLPDFEGAVDKVRVSVRVRVRVNLTRP